MQINLRTRFRGWIGLASSLMLPVSKIAKRRKLRNFSSIFSWDVLSLNYIRISAFYPHNFRLKKRTLKILLLLLLLFFCSYSTSGTPVPLTLCTHSHYLRAKIFVFYAYLRYVQRIYESYAVILHIIHAIFLILTYLVDCSQYRLSLQFQHGLDVKNVTALPTYWRRSPETKDSCVF